MKKHPVTFPQVGLIASTRAMLGAGAGLLLAGKLSEPRRTRVGWALVSIGVVTTLPLLLSVFRAGDSAK